MFKIVHKDIWRGENLERLKFLWIEIAEDTIRRQRRVDYNLEDTNEALFWKQIEKYDERLNQEEQEKLKIIETKMQKAVSYGYFLETKDLCAV